MRHGDTCIFGNAFQSCSSHKSTALGIVGTQSHLSRVRGRSRGMRVSTARGHEERADTHLKAHWECLNATEGSTAEIVICCNAMMCSSSWTGGAFPEDQGYNVSSFGP